MSGGRQPAELNLGRLTPHRSAITTDRSRESWHAHIDPVCRLCRREGIKLYLKGSRCDSPKCAIERRNVAARHARLPPRQAERVRRPPAREAEAQALLWRLRAPVPPLLRAGLALAGEHRRGAAEHHGAPAGQRRASARLRAVARRGPAAGRRTATSSVNGQHCNIPSLLLKAGDTVDDQEPAAQPAAGQAQPARTIRRRRPTSWSAPATSRPKAA